jgi:arginine-tRNA-protein transferase
VYTFYDPEFQHYSLGTYAVLWQIAKARELGMEHVYLGYWVENSQKMDYKKNFKPLEVYMNQQWQAFQTS